MELNEIDFEQELAKGPFAHKGFTDKLRKRIEAQVDRRKPHFRWWLPAVSGVSLAAVMIIGLLQLDGIMPLDNAASHKVSSVSMADTYSAERTQQTPIASALLIGLRSDLPSGDSAYRTVLIAPNQEGDQVHVAAEGSGILVPYGQQFWRIQTTTQKVNGVTAQHLIAQSAGEQLKSAANSGDLNANNWNHSDKLTFAANKYVAVLETNIASKDKISSRTRVEEITQINATNPKKALLQDVFGASSGYAGENWTIVRQQGKWLPQMTSDQPYLLPLSLPAAIVSYDALASPWEEMVNTQKDAVDAISSPKQDMVAIITPTKLYIYAFHQRIDGPPLLILDLKPNETMVMAQWATDQYISDWIYRAKAYLKN